MPRGPKPQKWNVKGQRDPLKFLLSIQNNPEVSVAVRVRAAVAALAYKHKPTSRGGIKEARQESASEAQAGAFAADETPDVKRVH